MTFVCAHLLATNRVGMIGQVIPRAPNHKRFGIAIGNEPTIGRGAPTILHRTIHYHTHVKLFFDPR